jgi:hypothetical protein
MRPLYKNLYGKRDKPCLLKGEEGIYLGETVGYTWIDGDKVQVILMPGQTLTEIELDGMIERGCRLTIRQDVPVIRTKSGIVLADDDDIDMIEDMKL